MAYESDFETLWGYFGVTLGSFAGLMGPGSGNVEKVLVLMRFFEWLKGGAVSNEHFQAGGFGVILKRLWVEFCM